MDRDQIIDAIEHPDPSDDRTFRGIFGRSFPEWLENESKLEDITASQTELRNLEQENAALKKAIAEREAALKKSREATARARQQIQSESAQIVEEIRKLDARIAALDKECLSLQNQVGELDGKGSEVERLQRKLDEYKSQERKLQARIDGFSDEERNDREMVMRLGPFVEKLEQHEKKMSELMSSIWSDLKGDSFDRMFS